MIESNWPGHIHRPSRPRWWQLVKRYRRHRALKSYMARHTNHTARLQKADGMVPGYAKDRSS